MNAKNSPPPGTQPDLGSTMRVASLIWQSVTEVAAGALVGWLLDWAFGTEKIFLLIGGLLGIGVGMTTFIRSALKESRRVAPDRPYRPSPGPDAEDSP